MGFLQHSHAQMYFEYLAHWSLTIHSTFSDFMLIICICSCFFHNFYKKISAYKYLELSNEVQKDFWFLFILWVDQTCLRRLMKLYFNKCFFHNVSTFVNSDCWLKHKSFAQISADRPEALKYWTMPPEAKRCFLHNMMHWSCISQLFIKIFIMLK